MQVDGHFCCTDSGRKIWISAYHTWKRDFLPATCCDKLTTGTATFTVFGRALQRGVEDRITAARASLLAWVVTNGTQVPRGTSTQRCLATYHGHDSLINAGTGCGKTLPSPQSFARRPLRKWHISLLKRLQVTQVCILLRINLVIHNSGW